MDLKQNNMIYLILTLVLMALSAYLSYYFTSHIYFKKGLMAAQEKYKNIMLGDVIGHKTLSDLPHMENMAFGIKALNLSSDDGISGNARLGGVAVASTARKRIEINCPKCNTLLIQDGNSNEVICRCGWVGKMATPDKRNAYYSSYPNSVGYPAGFQDANGKILPPFLLRDVMNKRVRYKNGDECIIVAGDEETGLFNKWDNGTVSGFGRLEDIQEIIE